MTQTEINRKRDSLELELLSLRAEMRKSDEHAIKCNKLGLVFAEEYPGEHEAYENARRRYNEAEEELQTLAAMTPEEEIMEG